MVWDNDYGPDKTVLVSVSDGIGRFLERRSTVSNWTSKGGPENQQVEQEQDNPAGTETAEEIEPTLHQEEADIQQEVNDAASEADDIGDEIDAEEEQLTEAEAEEEPAEGES
jgi:hypothetical protein